MGLALDAADLARIRHWMFACTLPFWAETGLDLKHGGPVETLTPDGARSAGGNFKRTRVTCRQVYVYSHAELLGWTGARAAADCVYAFLTQRLWRGPDQGWPRTVDVRGDVLDPTPDLYDYAFALFALGWRYKVRRTTETLELAHLTLDLIEARFRHPAGGFHSQLPPTLPRQQNPHMHLTEAMLVLGEASGDDRFFRVAAETTRLFKEKFATPDGVLREFFDDALAPAAGEEGRFVEPGHQFEWAWILAQHQKLTGADHTAIVRALVGCAEARGVDPRTQATFNRVRDDGLALDRGSRTWPNTERIKGWIGLHELTGVAADQPVAGSAKLLFDRYLTGPFPEGAWMDAFDAEGRPASEVIPTSTLYHLFLAFAEILRCADGTREQT
jgi:N-acylglucosamine 2-epimerase/mannose-6-phosphate isomerase